MRGFELRQWDQVNGIPRTALEEHSVGTFAGAEFTADTEKRVHFDASKGRMIRVRNPVHAVFHRAIFHACRRPGTARAIFQYDGDNMRLALAFVRRAVGFRLLLDDSSFCKILDRRQVYGSSHDSPYANATECKWTASFLPTRRTMSMGVRESCLSRVSDSILLRIRWSTPHASERLLAHPINWRLG